MKYCPQCDAKLKKNTKFCPECGMSLNLECEKVAEQSQKQHDEKHHRFARKKQIAIISIVLALIVIGTSAFLLIDKLVTRRFSPGEIYNLIAPSTVEIHAESLEFSSTGTGFFIDDKGTVITNYHVIEDCYDAEIILNDGTAHSVLGVLGYDEKLDVAILATGCAQSVPLAYREDAVVTGEKAYTLGSSLGLTGTFAEGIISSSNRKINGVNFIQTTAPISSGNSGGPLVDEGGNVIGITTAAFEEGQNLNIAVPIVLAINIDRDKEENMRTLFLRQYGLADDYGAEIWLRVLSRNPSDDTKEEVKEYIEAHRKR